jgi:UTP-glucose-1-phosphate uridylyltransferase
MRKPVLVIMAAGMGSRFGGLKQIEPVDEDGHIIMDFSIYDAKQAGFEEVVFVIKKENEEIFKEVIGNRISQIMKVSYAFQELDALPDRFTVPEGRVKPWGTGHAVLSCASFVQGPFVVINADDYYGAKSFQILYQYLMEHEDDECYRYAMAGYVLSNTLTENGTVARGVCQTDEKGYLVDITERTKIRQGEESPEYTEDGEHWIPLEADSVVSMNMWAFTNSFFTELQARFPAFLEKGLAENPLKCEYFLPSVVNELMEEKKAVVRVLRSEDKWYGVTYLEDKPMVVAAIKALKDQGVYPQKLWEA